MTDRYLDLVSRQLPICVWATDCDLVVLRAHGRIVRNLEAAGAKVVGATIGEIVGALGDVEEAVGFHRAVLAGEPQAYRAEFFERWWEVRVEPLRDARGGIEGCVGCAVDVSAHEVKFHHASGAVELAELHDVRQKLERSVSLLETTIDATADEILVIGRDGAVCVTNERFMTLWRVPIQSWRDARTPRSCLTSATSSKTPARSSRACARSTTGLGPNHSTCCASRTGACSSAARGRVGDAIEGRVWTFHDVTQRERLQRRAEFLANAGRLLASLDVESALAAVIEKPGEQAGRRNDGDRRAPSTKEGAMGDDTRIRLK